MDSKVALQNAASQAQQVAAHSSQISSKGACTQCRHENEEGVAFCEECGYPLMTKTPCPFCGTHMFGKKNICEFCGEWLLEGKCRFCEADIEERQTFCSECGNQNAEIRCPSCGEDSSFEVCINCGTPLTAAAKNIFAGQALEGLTFPYQNGTTSDSPMVDDKTVKLAETEIDELRKIKAYKAKEVSHVVTQTNKRLGSVSLFSDRQRESIDQLGDVADTELKRQEEERRLQEEERRRKEEEEKHRQDQLEKKALMAKAEGTLYVKALNATITVKNEDGIVDDKYWLWVNDKKIGHVSYSTGGQVAFSVKLNEGVNLVELRFDKASGVGTVASITIGPNNQKRRYGGSGNHLWMVIAQ